MPQLDELDSASGLVLRQQANRVVFNTITTDYTLVASDWGKWIEANSGSDIEITVPNTSSVAFGQGIAIPIVKYGSGSVEVVPGSGVTINSDGEDNLIPSQYKTVLLIHRGSNVWYLQGIGATGSSSGGGGGDVTAPTVTSATATGANTIVVVFSESVTATTAGWSFNNGGALTAASVSGSGTTWTFTTSGGTMSAGQTITRTYDSSTGNTVDGSANELASFTGASVTNSIVDGNLVFATEDGGLVNTSQVFTGADTGNAGWNNRGLDTVSIPANTSGRIWVERDASDAYDFILGLDTTNALQDYSSFGWGFYVQSSGGAIWKVESGTPSDASATVATGNFVGLYRNGATGAIKIQESTDENTWTDIVTLSGTSTAALYAVLNVQFSSGKMYYPKIKTL